MLSLNNKLLLLIFPLLLTACGFEPLYGKQQGGDAADALLSGVKVDPIPDRLGQQFRINLEDQLNPKGIIPPHPRYRLQATLVHTEAGIGVARDGTVSRYNVYLDSAYTLYRTSDGKEMTSGNLRHVSSYNNIINEYFSTYISQEDALKRGIAELSQLYRQRLAAYLTQNDGNPPVYHPPERPANPLIPEAPTGQNSLIPRVQGDGL